MLIRQSQRSTATCVTPLPQKKVAAPLVRFCEIIKPFHLRIRTLYQNHYSVLNRLGAQPSAVQNSAPIPVAAVGQVTTATLQFAERATTALGPKDPPNAGEKTNESTSVGCRRKTFAGAPAHDCVRLKSWRQMKRETLAAGTIWYAEMLRVEITRMQPYIYNSIVLTAHPPSVASQAMVWSADDVGCKNGQHVAVVGSTTGKLRIAPELPCWPDSTPGSSIFESYGLVQSQCTEPCILDFYHTQVQFVAVQTEL